MGAKTRVRRSPFVCTMQKTDEKLDELALQVGNIENEVFSEEGDGNAEIEVFSLLKCVNEVKTNYQNLHRELQEVQGLQKELSTTLQSQLRMMQRKCNLLKEKIYVKVPESSATVSRLLISPTSTGRKFE